MARLLKESYGWSMERGKDEQGRDRIYVYLDQSLSDDNTFDAIKILKAHHAHWDNYKRMWSFQVPTKEPQKSNFLNTILKTVIRELEELSAQKHKITDKGLIDRNSTNRFQNIVRIINDMIKDGTGLNKTEEKEFKTKLAAFKKELIDAFKSGEFKEKMAGILKIKNAMGPEYSLKNSMLIYMQRPDARMVKDAFVWMCENRNIKPNAEPITIIKPDGPDRYSKDEKIEITRNFLRKRGIRSLMQLTVGEREKFYKSLTVKAKITGWIFSPTYYDISDTEQMEGKEDLIGSFDDWDKLEWYDDKTPVDENSEKLYNAISNVITGAGLKLITTTEEELGTARGSALGNGEIRILKQPHNIGAVKTLVHEYSHELLHLTFLKQKDKNKYANFFVGNDNKEAVEQQAEISAWTVMRNYGYDMKESINYAGSWGADEYTAGYVLDTVAQVANIIIDSINKELKKNKDKLNEMMETNHFKKLTGRDVAELLGPEAVKAYDRAKRFDKEKDAVNEDFYSLLNRMDETHKDKDK